MRFFFRILFLLWLIFPITIQSGFAQKHDQELQRVKKHLDQERKNVAELRNRKISILDVLEDIQKKIHKSRQKEKMLTRKINPLTKRIEGTRKEMNQTEKEVGQSRSFANKRLVALYKMGELGALKVLFSSESFSDLFLRGQQLDFIIRKDLQTIRKFNQKLKDLRILRLRLENEKKLLEETRKEIRQTRRQMADEKTKKDLILKAVQGEEDIHKRYIAELEEAQKDLEKLLQNLAQGRRIGKRKQEDKGVTDRGFAARKGTLKPPVGGKITRKFGKYKDPKFFTYHFHKGIDIQSKPETEVRSVYEGKVVFSGWFKGFGQLIIVDHGGGYHTLAAQTEELTKEVGQWVQEGDLIGRMAPEGFVKSLAKPSPPVLYFEVRQKGKSVNPLDWLAPSEFM